MKIAQQEKREGNDPFQLAYRCLVGELEKDILAARLKMSQVVDREKNLLFYGMGKRIHKYRQGGNQEQGVFRLLAKDLEGLFSGMDDFSEKNIKNMERFYHAYLTIDYNPISMLPFSHHKLIINLVPDYQDRFDLADRALNNSWDLRKLLSKVRDRLPKWILLEWGDRQK